MDNNQKESFWLNMWTEMFGANSTLQKKLELKTAEARLHKESLKNALTKMEGLYRIIYGYHSFGEKSSDNQLYIAEQYCIQTMASLADENGWTGRKCKICDGTGESDSHSRRICQPCAGTGEENFMKITTEETNERSPI